MTRPELVFLHIPKTAGTSQLNAFSQYYGAGNVFWIGKDCAPGIWRYPRAQVGERFVVGGHKRLSFYPRHLDPLYCALLRDPIERAISLFVYHTRPELAVIEPWSDGQARSQLLEKLLARGIDPDSMLNSIRDCRPFRQQISNYQCRYLSRGRATFAAVRRSLEGRDVAIGTVASYDRFQRELWDLLDWTQETPARVNRSQDNYAAPYLQDEELVARIACAQQRRPGAAAVGGNAAWRPVAAAWRQARALAAPAQPAAQAGPAQSPAVAVAGRSRPVAAAGPAALALAPGPDAAGRALSPVVHADTGRAGCRYPAPDAGTVRPAAPGCAARTGYRAGERGVCHRACGWLTGARTRSRRSALRATGSASPSSTNRLSAWCRSTGSISSSSASSSPLRPPMYQLLADAQGREAPDCRLGISFRQFAEGVCSGRYDDPLWLPQYRYLAWANTYSRLYRPEELATLRADLAALTGRAVQHRGRGRCNPGLGGRRAAAAGAPCGYPAGRPAG